VEQKLDDDVTIGDIADAMYEIVEGEHGRPLPPAELFERLKERYAGVSVASFFRATLWNCTAAHPGNDCGNHSDIDPEAIFAILPSEMKAALLNEALSELVERELAEIDREREFAEFQAKQDRTRERNRRYPEAKRRRLLNDNAEEAAPARN
jgi:hypothetical protein